MKPNAFQRKRLKKMQRVLTKIDVLLNDLDRVDIYGDVVQNFEDIDRVRHTTRLLGMIMYDLGE